MCMRRSRCGGDLVSCVSQDGNTALYWANEEGHLEVVVALKAAGARQ